MKRKPTERPNTGRLPVSCPNVKRGIEQSLKRSVQKIDSELQVQYI